MVELERSILSERREKAKLVCTNGKRLADLEDLDIVSIAYGIFLQGEPGVAAAWEKRLYGKYRPIIEGGKEIRLRIKPQTQEKVISICRSNLRVIGDLDNRELPIFATIINDLRVKREKSRRYFRNKEQKRVLSMLPPATRLMDDKDIEGIRVNYLEHNPPVRARIESYVVDRGNLFRWGLVTVAAATGILGNAKGAELPLREPLLKDQARVLPAPDFAKSAPPEVARVHEVVKDTIANLPLEVAKPEILYRLVDGEGNYIKGAKVKFDGVGSETNGAGLIHIIGETSRSFSQQVAARLEIELPDGRKIEKNILVRGGLNSHVLKRAEEFIVVD